MVILCFLLVHYQVPQNRATSDLLMFGAGALLAALFRAHRKGVARAGGGILADLANLNTEKASAQRNDLGNFAGAVRMTADDSEV